VLETRQKSLYLSGMQSQQTRISEDIRCTESDGGAKYDLGCEVKWRMLYILYRSWYLTPCNAMQSCISFHTYHTCSK
jgi:hypothetical protein